MKRRAPSREAATAREARRAQREALAALKREQRSLRSLLQAVARDSGLRDLLTRIIRTACDLMEADHGTIALVHEDDDVIRIEAIHEMPASELGGEFRRGEGLVGEVWKRKRSVILQRYGDLSHPRRVDFAHHAVLGVPIRWGGTVTGVFGVGRSRAVPPEGVPPFDSTDIRQLETFARYASLAIHIANTAERERHRAARLALISRVGRLITANLRVEELLQTAADALHELLGYPNIAIPLLEPGPQDVLVVGTVGGHYKTLIRNEVRLPLTTGLMGAAARTRRTILVNDVTRDPRYFPTPNAKGIFAELAVPILLGDECLGVLNVESDRALREEDSEYLRIIADQLAVAIENARLHSTARELAVVDERHRLARELHDSVTQLIFSASLIAESLTPVWRRDPDEGERRTNRLLELSRLALGEMRALLSELRSAEAATSRLRQQDNGRGLEPVRAHGLPDAIRLHGLAALGDTCRIVVNRDRFRPMPSAHEDTLYRIAQEALFNIAKHARARRVTVRLARTATGATMRIVDDGAGLRRRRAGQNSGGHGLVFMRERAEQLGGSCVIKRGRTRGTVVEVALPIERRQG